MVGFRNILLKPLKKIFILAFFPWFSRKPPVVFTGCAIHEILEQKADENRIARADSIDELCTQIDVNPGGLKGTLARYNTKRRVSDIHRTMKKRKITESVEKSVKNHVLNAKKAKISKLHKKNSCNFAWSTSLESMNTTHVHAKDFNGQRRPMRI